MSLGPLTHGRSIRVAILGFGRVGTAVLELALTRTWLEVVAIVAKRAERDGEAATASVPRAPTGLRVRTDIDAALRDSVPDVVVMATTSRLPDVLGQLGSCLSAGVRTVVSTAEELAYVERDDGVEAAAIHDLVVASEATVVATGVNPGFVLDLWPLLLSGLAWDIERLEARRVVDVSVFAPHTRRQLGIGYEPEAFRAGVDDGSIAGHLGFRESLRILCHSMGQAPDRITIETEPIIASRDYPLADATITQGTSVGVTQRAVAWLAAAPWVEIEMLLHVAPEQDGVRTLDETHLRGRHELHAVLEPGAAAIPSTAAQLVNIIPTALRTAPGLYGPGQLPPSVPWLADTAPAGMPGPALGVV